MSEQDRFSRVSLLGGPLHQAGRRAGLVRGGSNTVRLGLALGWSLWLALLVLALAAGVLDRMFVLPLIGGHVRLLVVIPLLFAGESWMDPQVRGFVRSMVASGVVPVSERPTLATHLDRLQRWKDAWWGDALCLLAAVLFGAVGGRLMRFGGTAVYDPVRAVVQDGWTLGFYYGVGMTAFRFLVFRWLWRLGLWWQLLWRVSRLRLQLAPAHPDRAAGLGGLEVVQATFLPLVVALSAVISASYAEELSRGTMPFAAVYPALALLVMASVAVIVGPLLFFTATLLACRQRGLVDYFGLGSRYVQAFEQKWLSADPPEDPLLGTADVQSLADLAATVENVRGMRLVPASGRLLAGVAVCLMLPVLPLWLFQYPLADLIEKFVARLLGM